MDISIQKPIILIQLKHQLVLTIHQKVSTKYSPYEPGIKGDEIYLETPVAQGVSDIVIDVRWISFYEYTSGIYDNSLCTGDDLNHAVGLIGYGTENGIDYWIVCNSWGKTW